MTNDELQQIIRDEEVLVVHFSTAMSAKGLVFPDHIQQAIALSDAIDLCCSALSKNRSISPAGEVGVIFEPSDISQIKHVCATDAGFNGSHSLGLDPTQKNVLESLSGVHGSHNEWLVRGAPVKGILVLRPDGAHARKKLPPFDGPFAGTDPVESFEWFPLSEIRQAFPDQKIYTLDNGKLTPL